ncbi:unnamed protein product [Amoebophrya sp. A25]|nr:unnamed protein product [Amoebophrya sp. A25]|eukprot:GSA25T00016962001.1
MAPFLEGTTATRGTPGEADPPGDENRTKGISHGGGCAYSLLELFCGVGGMRFGLEYGGMPIDPSRSLAVDISPEALKVYRHNFHDAFEKDVDAVALPPGDDRGAAGTGTGGGQKTTARGCGDAKGDVDGVDQEGASARGVDDATIIKRKNKNQKAKRQQRNKKEDVSVLTACSVDLATVPLEFFMGKTMKGGSSSSGTTRSSATLSRSCGRSASPAPPGYDIWTMSPPCQPFSRQGHGEQLNDERSRAFLNIVDALRNLPEDALPKCLILENVVEFKDSGACQDHLLPTLRKRGFSVDEVSLLSPDQFGYPNSRTRCFVVATRRTDHPGEPEHHGEQSNRTASAPPSSYFPLPEHLQEKQDSPAAGPPSASGQQQRRTRANEIEVFQLDFSRSETHCPHGVAYKPGMKCIADFLQFRNQDEAEDVIEQRPQCLRGHNVDVADLVIPDTTLEKRSSTTLDVVFPQCQHSMCVTKAYGRFFCGTGSVLAHKGEPRTSAAKRDLYSEVYLSNSKEGSCDVDVHADVEERHIEQQQHTYMRGPWSGRLRFFHPLEVFALMGFVISSTTSAATSAATAGAVDEEEDSNSISKVLCRNFSLPPSITRRQAWALAGNSLNPQIVAFLARKHFLRKPWTRTYFSPRSPIDS